MSCKITKGVRQLNEIETLSSQLGQKLLELGWIITTAESCTGGGISSAITEVAGSSAYFERSFITYSNEAKAEMLGVASELISEHGAVSAEVVQAMALGALSNANANIAIAVSGIAGPGGGTEEKPVGTVYLAIAIQYLLDKSTKSTVNVLRLNLTGDRQQVRRETVKYSIINTLDLINEKK